MKLHTNIKSLGFLVSDKKTLKVFLIYVYMSFFYPRVIFFNNLSKGLLDKATYQISKAWAFDFNTRKLLSFSLYGSM